MKRAFTLRELLVVIAILAAGAYVAVDRGYIETVWWTHDQADIDSDMNADLSASADLESIGADLESTADLDLELEQLEESLIDFESSMEEDIDFSLE